MSIISFWRSTHNGPMGHDLNRMPLRVGDPGAAKRCKKIVRRTQAYHATYQQGSICLVGVVGPDDEFCARETGVQGQPVVSRRCLNGGNAQSKLAQAHL